MKKYLGFKKRSLFSLAAIALAFTMVSPLSIYAAEPVDQSDLALQSVGVTREEAIAMFGLTEEEAANMTYGAVAERARSIDYSVVNPLMKEWTDKWNRTINN